MNIKITTYFFTVILILLLSATSQAQESAVFQKDDPNQLVDSDYGRPSNSRISMNKNTGAYIVVWECIGRIYGKFVNASGQTTGAQFQINTNTTYAGHFPAAAMNNSGDFVVSWTSTNQDGDVEGIYAQRFNSSGTKQGAEFRVNTTTASVQKNSTAGIDNNGNFIIAWTSAGQDGSGYGIYAQRFDNAGAAQGSEFLINTYTTSDQDNASISMTSNGGFIITWNSSGQDGSGYGVYAQRFNPNGTTIGTEFRVNTTTANDQNYPSIGINTTDNSFVITWSSNSQDGSNTGVYAQRFASGATTVGSEFLVNTYTTNAQYEPSIAVSDNGTFVIAWSSTGQLDAQTTSIVGKLFDTDGTAKTLEFFPTVLNAAFGITPGVAMDINGKFAISWSLPPGSSDYIHTQQSSDLVFAPRFPAQEMYVSNITSTSMTINWGGGDGQNRIVIIGRTEDGPTNIDYVPSSGQTYSANSVFGLGSSGTGLGNFYMVYIGSGGSVTVTGLNPSTSYDFLIIEFNGTMPNNCLQKQDIATGSASTTTVTGIKEEQALSQVKLFPNPTKGPVTIEAEGSVMVNVMDNTGRLYIENINITDTGVIDLSKLKSGLYTIQLTKEQSHVTKKIVIE